jgi:hypothetical protein
MKGWMVWLLLAVGASIAVSIVLILLVTSDPTTVLDLEVGDCFMIEAGGDKVDITSVEVIGCDRRHDAEVVLVGELNPDADRKYLADNELFAEVDRQCATVPADLVSGFGLLPVAPNEASWQPFKGRFLCVAIPYGGTPVTGSLIDG